MHTDTGMFDAVDCALVLDAVNKVLQRREYFREKQRSHRRKQADEIRCLKQQAADLQVRADRVRRAKPIPSNNQLHTETRDDELPWRVIAAVFRQQSRAALADHADLVQAVSRNRLLVQRMHMWAAQNEPIPVVPRAIVRWQQVTLTDDPIARKLTKEWATQQMYHNTGAAFRGFPASMNGVVEDYAYINCTLDGLVLTLVECKQFVWSAPLQVVGHMLRHHMHELSFMDPSAVSFEWTENTVLFQIKLPDGDSAATVMAHFLEADRRVVVHRLVHSHDSLRDVDGAPVRDAQSMAWLDLRRLDNRRTFARTVKLTSIQLKQSGSGSMEDVAAAIGMDWAVAADGDRPELFRQHYLRLAQQSEVHVRKHLQSVLHKVHATFTASSTDS